MRTRLDREVRAGCQLHQVVRWPGVPAEDDRVGTQLEAQVERAGAVVGGQGAQGDAAGEQGQTGAVEGQGRERHPARRSDPLAVHLASVQHTGANSKSAETTSVKSPERT